MININRTLTIAKKEIIHIKRDRASLVIALILPIFLLLLFGFAVSSDVDNLKLSVYDGSKSIESRELINSLNNSTYLKVYEYVDTPDAVEKSLDYGRTKIGVIIPDYFTTRLRRGEPTDVQFLIDGSDPYIAKTAASYSALIVNHHSQELQKNVIKPFNLLLYNPTLESSKFNIPGIIGLILQNITIMLTAFSIVREKEKGTMEQLIMTPITPLELVIGKIIPYVFIAFLELDMTLILGKIIFGVDIKGSLTLLITLGTIFLTSSLAIGIFISTISNTQLEAMHLSLAYLLPSVILSGFVFPREAMPKIIYFVSCFIPLTYFNEILRGIILKGVGFKELLQPIAALMGLIIVIIIVSIKKFKKTLD
ncbi:ABC transporter permease [Cetobacterium sp. 2G large]|uniref:ABC transporter permease n=1 Tax=Cetobacterium sp. 2G large TaxID=2759680 RepID=UPI00163C4949|nr:ABC transporter permease [Cetobacterium sp. 2G large]MBC2853658.1 ABC transporter permease [Cetobacterium sp. 2G large]